MFQVSAADTGHQNGIIGIIWDYYQRTKIYLFLFLISTQLSPMLVRYDPEILHHKLIKYQVNKVSEMEESGEYLENKFRWNNM